MFLLNQRYNYAMNSSYKFTIQNVPIKLFNDYALKYDYTDLQYKMFLLNPNIFNLPK